MAPSPPSSLPSSRCCASIMVLRAVKSRVRPAPCVRVGEVQSPPRNRRASPRVAPFTYPLAPSTPVRPPGLLRVHLLGVDLAGMEEGRLDRALRDLVEHDPEGFSLRHPQLFREVPADGLAFAIRVRRDVQRVGLLRRLLELVEDLLLGG